MERSRHPVSGHYSTYPPLQTCVAGLVTPNFAAPWLGPLVRAAGGRNPIKWGAVEKAVVFDRDESARSIREGLRHQTVIVTDPMETVRTIDLRIGPNDRFALSLLLDDTAGLGRGTQGRQLRKALHGVVLSQILESSGIGNVAAHIAQAYSGDLDGQVEASGSRYRDLFMETVKEGVGGSIRRAIRLATGASSLAAPLVDSDSAFNRYASSERALSFERMRWGSPDPHLSRAALKAVGRRRLVFDQGHNDSATMVDGVRKFADIHASGSDWDLFDAENSSDSVDEGFVKEESDDNVLSLQVADVAAGWARTLLAKGYQALCEEFRCVVYNGSVLTKDAARDLDRSIGEHRALHEKALRVR